MVWPWRLKLAFASGFLHVHVQLSFFLYSYSQRSCQPQPRRSRRVRKDTMQDRGCSLMYRVCVSSHTLELRRVWHFKGEHPKNWRAPNLLQISCNLNHNGTLAEFSCQSFTASSRSLVRGEPSGSLVLWYGLSGLLDGSFSPVALPFYEVPSLRIHALVRVIYHLCFLMLSWTVSSLGHTQCSHKRQF